MPGSESRPISAHIASPAPEEFLPPRALPWEESGVGGFCRSTWRSVLNRDKIIEIFFQANSSLLGHQRLPEIANLHEASAHVVQAKIIDADVSADLLPG